VVEQEPTSGRGDRAPSIIDLLSDHPLWHFVQSETLGALAGLTIYAVFRACAYCATVLTHWLPLEDPGPAHFLDLVLSWGGALGAAATFAIITIYQIAVLIMRLWERMH
jgi:hypothetical protein